MMYEDGVVVLVMMRRNDLALGIFFSSQPTPLVELEASDSDAFPFHAGLPRIETRLEIHTSHLDFLLS
jgi:hypothetical protein